MATPSESEPPSSEVKNKPTGVTIDSSLIQTTSKHYIKLPLSISDLSFLGVGSSDVQSELSVLGVNVYNQQEFEAGVLRQIDTEVQRRNAEQDKKFLLKEYNNIKAEIK